MKPLLSLVVVMFCAGAIAQAETRPNILLIAVDDLRPQLNCYGQSQMKTPNIDRLAADGLLFERAYCMVPTCGASRSALMTGIRPSRNRFVTHLAHAGKEVPSIKTFNTLLQENGYQTVSLGKVFHHLDDNAQGWSEPPVRPGKGQFYRLKKNRQISEEQRAAGKTPRGPAFESADFPDGDYPDGQLAELAVETLGRLKDREEPFFLAVGFYKPHLPFVCPQKYWDLYSEEEIKLPENSHAPEHAPQQAMHNSGELRNYFGIPAKGVLEESQARQLIHGYYACVSFTDTQIGKLLDELDRLKLSENTIVIFWGDHGWSLGEHTLWCKHSCFEMAMRIPLILRVPGMAQGARTTAITESIDLYPTLCDLTQIEKPAHLMGESLLPLLHDPDSPGKGFAIGRFSDGDTLRLDQARFTQYSRPGGQATGRMLYLHERDPAENHNLAESADVADLVEQMSRQLQRDMGRDDKLAP